MGKSNSLIKTVDQFPGLQFLPGGNGSAWRELKLISLDFHPHAGIADDFTHGRDIA